MSKNTIKYEYTQGCPNDVLGVLSMQAYDGKGSLNIGKHIRAEVKHDLTTDVILKVNKHETYREAGKIIKREVVKAKVNDEPIH